MPRFDVRADFREVRKYLAGLERGVDRAASRAINKTITPVRAEAARQIQHKRNLKIGVIKKSMKVTRATFRRLVGTIQARGFSIPIRHFGARQTRGGVSVKVSKKGRRIQLRKYGNKSFIVAKLGGNVFVRNPAKRMRSNPKKEAIEKWPAVPGIPRVFVQRQVQRAMQAVAARVWPKRFREELRHEIRKAAAKARTR